MKETAVEEPFSAHKEASFEELFSAHAVEVHRYIARRHVGNDVDDLVAEVFTLAWQKWNEIPDDFELQWLYRTAWFVLANAHRKQSEMPIDTSQIEGFTADIADVVIEQSEMRRVWLEIPERDREILRLVAWEGLTPPEVAAVLEISTGGASSAISRARKNLTACMEVNEETEESVAAKQR
jgi:RNA polymerase sigma-70 factor (ECF subfamily)